MVRHYYIAKPFPDELIGSVLIRTARHRGIGLKAFTGLLATSSQTKLPLLLSHHLDKMSLATRASPMELLHYHTLFRFITAFMSAADTDRFAANIVSGNHGSLASFVRSVTAGATRPRYCPQCVRRDLYCYGESYWHRSHNVPFVQWCYQHRSRLHELPKTAGYVANRLPEECVGEQIQGLTPHPAFDWLAEQSINTLETRFRRSVDEWFGVYREIAFRRGFPRESSGICGRSLCAGLHSFFGGEFFDKAGWQFTFDGKSWPALMFRDSHSTAVVTGKHLVIQAFLKFAPVPTKEQTAKPGKKRRDVEQLDRQCYRVLQRRMSRETVVGRPSAHLLLMELGLWGMYRHERRQLPMTRLLVRDWYLAYRKLMNEQKRSYC